MEVITAYNFVVDSNVESPASVSPSAAHLGAKITNTGTTTLTNVVVNIGTLTTPATSSGTPGTFPPNTVTVSGANGYSGTFSLVAPGGAADAVRVIPSIAPGETVSQYFFVTYPLKDGSGNSVAGAAPDPLDDLQLDYDIWAYATEAATTRRVNERTKVTMRNEISAMANKIWPNGDNKVPDEYLNAIEASLGWRPSASSPRIPGAIVKEGIWFDLGNVGAGFDNNGDGLPDRNAWMQPVGDPTKFSPLAARLVKCYGIVIVKLNDGTEQLIPFEDRMYFENLPGNNTGAVGLVYYEFIPLNPALPSTLTPYQEVASGFDNEKFNGDYGTAVGLVSSDPPSVSLDKTLVETSLSPGGTASYRLITTNTGTVDYGWPQLSLPIVMEDGIPSGLVYVSGSATTGVNATSPTGGVFTVFYSTNGGASWTTTEPVPASTVNRLRWVLDRSLAPAATATVAFQTTIPSNYSGYNVVNTGILKSGTETEVATDTVTTPLSGVNSLGNFVWRDLDRDGIQDGGAETGIANIGVTLYADTDGDGVLDVGEPLVGTTSTDTNGAYLFSSLPDSKYIAIVDSTDAQLPYGFTLKAGVSDRYSVDLDSARVSAIGVSNLNADWPFILGLEITKAVSPTTYLAGDLITYDIHLDNHMNTLTLPVSNTQTIYANSTAFSANNADGKASENQASRAPNSLFTFVDWQNNADNLVSTGVTPSFTLPGGSAITKVELIIRGFQSTALVNDQLDIRIGHSDRSIALFQTRTTSQMNALIGVSQDLVIEITSAAGVTPGWTATEINSLSAALVANKTSGGDPGDYYVDSIGFRVTTNNVPFAGTAGPNTISQWPIIDTYDSNKLEYVTASVPPDITTPLGTLAWHNLGPVNAGARKSITVTFRAKTPTDTNADGRRDPMTATNTISTDGSMDGHIPLFQSGLPAGHDDSSVNVTINPAGSIGDFVYWDVNANSSFGAGDLPLSGVIVQLFQNPGSGFVFTGRTQITNSSGYYEFGGLADGTYQVRITTATTGDLFSLPWTTFTSFQKGTAGTNQTGFVQGDSVTINNADFLTTNDSNLLQDFGFDSNSASLISGTLFRDWDGDGVQDAGDEPLVGLTITLSGGTSRTTTTDSNGFYQFTNITSATSHTVTVTTPPTNHTQTKDPDVTFNNATTINPVVLGTSYTNRDFAYRPSGALTIGDTLYYDWNGNGTQNAGEVGIPNISMLIYQDENGDGVVNSTDALVASTSTNSTGFYQFTGLLSGNYIVVVDENDLDFPPLHVQTQDYDGLVDDSAKITLSSSLNTVDFGYLPVGTASIGNLVWLDFDSDGIKDSGESGINGVTVELYHSSQTPGVHAPLATTTTSGGGLYSFTNLSANGYYVYIPASNFGSGQALQTYPLSSPTTSTTDNGINNDDNGTQASSALAVVSPLITLSAAESDQTIDFGFTGVGSIGDTVFYDVNANGIQDYSETGIQNVIVELYVDADNNGVADGAFIATDTTDSSGYYQFTGLATKTYIVKVRTSTLPVGAVQTADPDLDGVPVNNSDLSNENDGDHSDTSIVLFAGSTYTGADFGYQMPGSIGDFVWLDIDRDGVQDFGEPGLEGVTVRITNGVTTYNVVTDYDGLWAQTVANGSWTVSIPSIPSGYAATYDADSGTTSPNASVAVTVSGGVVTVPSGVENMELDFGLALNGAYSLSGTIAINDSGVVGKHSDVDDFIDDGVDQDAGPNDETELSGVVVYLYTSTGTPLGSTVTDSSGNYSFIGLPNGSYRVIIGTTAVPLDRAVLTTTTANAGGATVTSTSTSVTQAVTISGASLQNIDFMFDPTVEFDLGDLPSSFGITTLNQDGARHIIPGGGSTVYLGTPPDADINGAASLQANGDDILGGDDENGVVFNTATWVSGAGGGTGSVQVTGIGWLVAWIDWNGDNDFLDDNEMITDRAISGGTTTITFAIPSGEITGGNQSWYSRFRVFTAEPPFPTFAYVGEATDGEVEDYLVQKTAGASIGDYVWNDLDGDGVQDSGESGIGGLTVQLRNGSNVLVASQTTGNGTTDVDGDGVTDPVGYYRFRTLGPDTYSVTVSTPPTGFDPSYDENGTGTANITTVVLAANVQHLTADFGYEPRLANISGQVRYDADGDGDPADPDSGANFVTIQLWTDPDGNGNPSDGEQVGQTYTDTSGNYLFSDVPTGNYVVIEVNPAGTTSTYDVQGSATDDRIAVSMVGTNITGRDFLDTVPPLYSIAGIVYADTEENNTIDALLDVKVASVLITLYFDRDGNGVVSSGDPEVGTAITDGNGAYSFSGIPAGLYVIEETNPLGATSEFDVQGSTTDDMIAVNLTANVTGRNFLDDGAFLGSIGDYVWLDADSDGVQDSNELPLSGVRIYIDTNNDGDLDAGEPYDDTDSSGLYTIPNLTAGSKIVRVLASTLPTGVTQTGDPDGPTMDGMTTVSLGAGDTHITADFGYQGNLSIGDRVWNDRDGDGVQESGEEGLFELYVFIDLDGDGTRDHFEPVDFTDINGNYSFDGLIAGTYKVMLDPLSKPAGVNVTGDPDSTKDGIHTVVLTTTSRTDVDFGLQGQGSISGQVWNDRDNDGVIDGDEILFEGVRVFLDKDGDGLYDAGTEESHITSSVGYYEFGNLAAATYAIVVDTTTLPAGLSQTYDNDGLVTPHKVEVILAPNDLETNINYGYRGNASIGDYVWNDMNGNGVQDPTEPPISGIRVFLDLDGDNGWDVGEPNDITDASGGYLLDYLPPGTYVVAVDPTHYPNGSTVTGDRDVTKDGKTTEILAAAEVVTNADFGFQGNGSIGDYVWYDIDGDGVQDAGEPALSGVRVFIDEDNNGTYEVGEPVATTSGSGAYLFSGLIPNTYRVRVDAGTLPSGLAQSYDLDGVGTSNLTTVVLLESQNLTTVDFGYEGTATLNGHLYIDTNGNRTQDGLEADLSGVDLVITDALGGVQRVTTDVDGNWTATVVPGSTSVNVDETDNQYPTGHTQTEGTDPTTVTAVGGQNTFAGNDGYFLPGSIGDFVWQDLDADGLQDVGESGISGVVVTLYRPGFGANGTSGDGDDELAVTTATTTGSGAYGFTGLLPGDYTVTFGTASGFTRTLADVGSDTTDSDANATTGSTGTITVGPGDSITNVDAGYYATGTISGHLYIDANGNGVQDGGEIDLPNVDILITASNGTTQTVSTNSSGNWSATVPPGSTIANVQESDPQYPTGYTQTEGTDPTVVVAVSGQNTSAGNDGYFLPGSIGNFVWDDANRNGQQDIGESGIAGVGVKLYRPGFGADGIEGNSDDALSFGTVFTDGGGLYSFTGLRPGNYVVEFTAATGYQRSLANQGDDASDSDANATTGLTSTVALGAGQNLTSIDAGYYEGGVISGTVLADTYNNGTSYNGISGVTLTLYTDPNGDGDPGDGVVYGSPTTTGVDGTYSFNNLPVGDYVVVETQPTSPNRYLTLSDGDVSNPSDDASNVSVTDNLIPVSVEVGETDSGNDFIELLMACPNLWADWQTKWTLGDETPTGNSDGDMFSNLIEYAFCLPPTNGSRTPFCMATSLTNPGDKIDAVFNRTAGGALDVTYELQYTSTLSMTTSWTTISLQSGDLTITYNTNGTETVRIKDVEGITGLTGGSGFIRMKVTMGAYSATTEVGGWTESTLNGICRTGNTPYVSCPAFSGTVASVSGQNLVMTDSSGGLDLTTVLTNATLAPVTGYRYYVEITSGTYEGHRFDVTASGVNSIALANDTDLHAATAPFNTLVGAPPDLTGATFVVRTHHTLGSLFPVASFTAAADAASATNIQFRVDGGAQWTGYWLKENSLDADTWALYTDTADQATTVVPPSRGFFIQNTNTGGKFMTFGKVRENDFVRPLALNANLVGAAYPLTQSAAGTAGRAMRDAPNGLTQNNDFVGTLDFKTADQFLIWKGDNVANTSGYDTYYQLTRNGSSKWVKVGDALLTSRDATSLFYSDRAVFVDVGANIPLYLMPAPWLPDAPEQP